MSWALRALSGPPAGLHRPISLAAATSYLVMQHCAALHSDMR